ncbi:hypothetical protein [Streptomyces sp. NPDC058701]|uniref:hypothetical protein n=1 Tax=Streptomyces sp. NPDC058701 TaxID=3346608 RepID=UPI00364A8896
MEITSATRPGHGHGRSAELVLTGGHFAALLDVGGATPYEGEGGGEGPSGPASRVSGRVGGSEGGHDIDAGSAARALGGRLADGLLRQEQVPLSLLLREALRDLPLERRTPARVLVPSPPPGPPGEPPATAVAVVRERGDFLDLLVLGDAAVVLQFPDRTVNVVRGGPRAPLAHPQAAGRTVVGSLASRDVRRVCLLTGAAHELAVRSNAGWPRLLERLAEAGPGALVAGAPYASATVALCTPGRVRG